MNFPLDTGVRRLLSFVNFICLIDFQLNRALVEAVGNAHKFGGVGRNPKPDEVKRLLEAGAQPDFVMPWLPDNKRRR